MAAVEAIALSASVAGALDISATAAIRAAQGMPPIRLLQFVASGALGASSFDGGRKTASLGLLLHFLIAGVIATIYYAVSHVFPIGLGRPVLFGALYGMTVHLVMSGVVVPLSRAPKREFSLKAFLTQLVVHIFFVGLPIALTQNYLTR
jgi:uncharacterized membrane protein YagU involved in acid resistance